MKNTKLKLAAVSLALLLAGCGASATVEPQPTPAAALAPTAAPAVTEAPAATPEPIPPESYDQRDETFRARHDGTEVTVHATVTTPAEGAGWPLVAVSYTHLIDFSLFMVYYNINPKRKRFRKRKRNHYCNSCFSLEGGKNMKAKKTLSVTLAAAMAAGLLAGCGGSASTATSTAEAASTADSTSTAASTEAEAPAAAGKVYYLNFKPEQDEAWQDLAKKYTEETGVPVTCLLYTSRCV